jgi:hypothetical protein
MRVHGRYIEFIRYKYARDGGLNIMGIFEIYSVKVPSKPNKDGAFSCLVAGCTDIPDELEVVNINIRYSLYNKEYFTNVSGLYSRKKDAVYFNLDNFVPVETWN